MGLSPAERTRLWRAERQRLGLVKLELWAPPSAKADILAAARAIVTASSRGPALLKNPDPPQGSFQMDHVIDTDWSVKSLADALSETRLLRDGELTARVLEGTEPVLQITMHEFGDVTSDLSIPKIYYWAPVLLGVVASALATLVFIVRWRRRG